MAVPTPTQLAGQFLGWLTHRQPAPVPANPRVAVCAVIEEEHPDDDEQTKLVRRFIAGGRVALLLRPAIAQTMTPEQSELAVQYFARSAALIVGGPVMLSAWNADDPAWDAPSGRVCEVAAFWCDRDLVTNRQFAEFVAHGGYRQPALWEEVIWPRVSELRDRSGQPGPRGWEHSTYPAGHEDWPVVGLSWYEADAYARWAGKRLPTDAEWVKVAACPVAQGTTISERRFPWGDVWDPEATHFAVSDSVGPASVDSYPSGVSSEGVRQLLGNVWEWTADDFLAILDGSPVRFGHSYKSLRGGAFDTHFPQQASCQLQSGESALARRPNIGFRCVVSANEILTTA